MSGMPAAHGLDEEALRRLRDEELTVADKGFPPGGTVAQLCAGRPPLTEAGFSWPMMTLSEPALDHNIASMADFCAAHGMLLAPHGKTSMAPQLFARQLAAGGWGITAATPAQARTYRAYGVPRVLLANELVDPGAVAWLCAELDADPGFEFLCYADSVAGVAILAESVPAAAQRRVDVLVELGHAGGRAGVRDIETLREVAEAVVEAPGLRLVGVSGYEGTVAAGVGPDDLLEVRAYLRRLASAAAMLRSLVDGVCYVSAGGSKYFDLVAEELAPLCADPDHRVVLRSGCYVSHDSGLYEQTSPLTRDGGHGLLPALRAWGQVLSRPEPGLVLVGLGRRDVPFDAGLPVVEVRWRRGAPAPEPAPAGTVTQLNDQHAFLTVDPDGDWTVGELVGLGISHPCTAFDKWRLIPLLDAEFRMVDAIRTFF